MLLSVGLHAGIFLGIGKHRAKTAAPIKDEYLIALVPLPQIKELEEPEPAPSDDIAPAVDLATLVPMQQDLPQLPQPNDFVQAINFATLLEQPDFSKVQVYVIPENIRSGGKIAEKIGKIFDLADLDRPPEPVMQPAPIYPPTLRREGLAANVHLEFIVDASGRVTNAIAIESSDKRFDEAAIAGVSKWRFRAGIKAGRKVNTRMRVPIVFKVVDLID